MAADARKTVIDMSDLKDLEPLAKRLNSSTDDLNKALQTIQDRLNALGIGVEVWVENHPLHESGYRAVLNERDEPTGEKEYDWDELGYGRHGDGWALLVRQRRFVVSRDEYGREAHDAFDESPDQPLLRASRRLRLAAVPRIPKLIDAIKAAAEDAVAAVETAKKIADSLK
jgi:hypothetical protein